MVASVGLYGLTCVGDSVESAVGNVQVEMNLVVVGQATSAPGHKVRLGPMRLLGLERGASGLIEIKALLSEELLHLAHGDDIGRHGFLSLGGRGFLVRIYARDVVVEEFFLDGDQGTQDVVCVG